MQYTKYRDGKSLSDKEKRVVNKSKLSFLFLPHCSTYTKYRDYKILSDKGKRVIIYTMENTMLLSHSWSATLFYYILRWLLGASNVLYFQSLINLDNNERSQARSLK